MNLFSILNTETYPRIFKKALEEGKKVVCMEPGFNSDIAEGEEYILVKTSVNLISGLMLQINSKPGSSQSYGYFASRFKVKDE